MRSWGYAKFSRSKTRRRLTAAKRKKFKVEPLLQEFKAGQKVVIKHDPSSHRGMPNIRYRGKIGMVMSKRGSAYVLSLNIGKKHKEIITCPEHLKLIKQ